MSDDSKSEEKLEENCSVICKKTALRTPANGGTWEINNDPAVKTFFLETVLQSG